MKTSFFLWNYIWVSHKNFCYETYYRRGHITKNQGEVTKAVQSSFLYEMYLSLYQSLDFCFGWLSNKSSLWCSIRENCRRLSEQVQRNWLGSFLPRSLVVPLSDNIPIPFSWRMRGIKTLSSKSHAASSASMYEGLEWRGKKLMSDCKAFVCSQNTVAISLKSRLSVVTVLACTQLQLLHCALLDIASDRQ